MYGEAHLRNARKREVSGHEAELHITVPSYVPRNEDHSRL